MRYPDFVKTIYLASPSMGCATSYYKPRLLKAIQNLSDFTITEGPYIYNAGILSSSPSNLGNEINQAFGNYDLIWSVGGGEVMLSILDYIDFKKIKSSTPSWFMGFSDNTNLTFLLNTICDTASIYGMNAPEAGADDLDRFQLDHIELIKGNKLSFDGHSKYEIESLKSEENPYASLNATVKSKISTYPKGVSEISGRIIGGCIDVLSSLVGTKYDNMKCFNSKYNNIVFMLEACDMNGVEVYRRLLQMKNSGWFDSTCAFVFGRPIHTEDVFDISYKDYIISALKDLNLPIIFDLDIGHVKPQIPVICGSICHIKIKGNKYNISYELK